ncbi:MAG: NMD3-related protein [Candidatus Nanoarchaeia archaeon]|nr:NMD3-related protein [Candidatus Nanoarchaeia archaeon]
MLNPPRPDYYEAKVQLRPAKEKLVRYVIEEVENSKSCRIAKIEELKTGIDIYISSRRFAMALGKKLKKRFDGKLTLSKQLYTQHKFTSKLLYRVTILFRLKEE